MLSSVSSAPSFELLILPSAISMQLTSWTSDLSVYCVVVDIFEGLGPWLNHHLQKWRAARSGVL